jgi:Mg-chelatase subunit ChlD
MDNKDDSKWDNLKETANAPKDEIIAIIDRSGSMANIIDDAVGGFNAFIDANKKLDKPANITFVKFDDVVDIEPRTDLAGFRTITVDDVAPRGMTAMNDAIGMTRSGFTPEDEGAMVEVVIITDGGENSSKEYTDRSHVKKMITELDENDNWTFTFLAANMDAFAEAGSFGFSKLTTQSFEATGEGITQAYAYAATSTVMRRRAS